LSATILSEEIYDVISVPQAEGAMFTHGFTYSGHPVACRAGLTNIEIMQREKICEHVREIGPYFEEQLATLSDLEIVGDVRGKCMMMCVENVANKETKELFDPSVNIGGRVAEQCQKRGLIIRPVGHLNVMSPPLILTRPEIDEMVAILRDGIVATIDELRSDTDIRGKVG
jgi:adenosylmethionine-8-amino-7-oxononanoate aminotransferase